MVFASAFMATQLAGPRICACGPELGAESSLLYDFGVSPGELEALTDQELLGTIEAAPNAPEAHRLAASRALLWDPVLKYRTVPGPDGVEIPLGSGRWRVGRVTHPRTGRVYDVVHWADIDDSSYSLYFRWESDELCQIAFEN
ncbi:MAG: hypothetical protein CME06_15160 [Gemmatimonadetes bacterium]|nr:hypothetical protein [Gemmatimonadota bacterium]